MRGRTRHRLFRDVYAFPTVSSTTRCVLAAASLLLLRAVVTGRSAAVLTAAVTRRCGVLVTSPAVTAVTLVRTDGLDDAVIALDRFVSSGVVDLTEGRATAGDRVRRPLAR